MHNLQGIITKSVNNATMQFEKLGYLATDAANYSTNSYKSTRFENYLHEDGRLDGVARVDYSNGSLYRTNNPFEVALSGAGFVPVTRKDGTVAYTRDCSFATNKDGVLTTIDGSIVGDGIKIPATYREMTIKKDGTVAVSIERDKPELVVGKIPLVQFNNPEGLKQLDGNMVGESNTSGKPILVKDNDYFRQGMIEKSNVDLYATVNQVLSLNASMIASTRLIKVVDDIYSKSINLKS